MTVAAEPEITNLDRVRPDVANQCRPHEKTVAIEFNAASIVVVMKTALDRVALAHEVLAKDAGDVNVLMARVEAIQAAIGIFLEHREVSGVELITVVVESAKH